MKEEICCELVRHLVVILSVVLVTTLPHLVERSRAPQHHHVNNCFYTSTVHRRVSLLCSLCVSNRRSSVGKYPWTYASCSLTVRPTGFATHLHFGSASNLYLQHCVPVIDYYYFLSSCFRTDSILRHLRCTLLPRMRIFSLVSVQMITAPLNAVCMASLPLFY